MKYWIILTVLALVVVAGCGGGGGDSGGSIEGTVTNNEGTPLPGATVSVGGVSTRTNNSGSFTLQNVAVGSQVVSASLPGYLNAGRGSALVIVVKGQTVSLPHDLILVPTAGGEVYLRNLEASSTDFRGASQQRLGGTLFFNSLSQSVGYLWPSDNTLKAIYSLGRRYSRLKSQIGVSDEEPDLNAEVVFTVLGDGNILYRSNHLKVGIVETVDVDVSSVLTLELRVTRVVADPDWPPEPTVVWGDPRLVVK